jgi:ATP-dependent Lon protease
VVLPRHNEGALEDVPEEVRGAIRFVLVESVDEALDAALPRASEEEGRDVQERARKTAEIPPPVH